MTKRQSLRRLTRLFALVAIVAAGTVLAEGQNFRSGPRQVNLIELYTSEGCSSCPPADRWLALLRHNASLWSHFVPVAFHVDYWDYLGWTDDFARAEFSNRQRRYDRLGQVNGVYTPGMLLNGHEWRQWRRGEKHYGEIEQSASGDVGELELTATGERYHIRFLPAANQAVGKVHVALLGMDIESRIGAGENRGKILRHDFVVLDFANAPLTATARHSTATVDAFPLTYGAKRYAIAAWITDAEDEQPLQVVGGWLHQ